MIRRRNLDRTLRGGQRAPDWIRPEIQPVSVLVPVNRRQQSPTSGLLRRIRDCSFQRVPCDGVLFRSSAFDVAEITQRRLGRSQLVRAFVSQDLTDAARQDSVRICYGSNDSRREIVLQFKETFRRKSALIVLRPKVRTGDRVDELHRDAQPRTGLPQVAFHHVARAEFTTDEADVRSLAGITRSGAKRYHLEIGEARQGGYNFVS